VDKNRIKDLQKWKEYIRTETRSKNILFVDKPDGELVQNWKIDKLEAKIGIRK
jgi:hypothetical protein